MTNVFVWSASGGGKFQLSGSRLSAGAARNITHEARKQNRSRQNFSRSAHNYEPRLLLKYRVVIFFFFYFFLPNTTPLSEQQSDCHHARSGGKSWSAAGKCCCAAVLFIGAGPWVGFLLGFKALYYLLKMSNILITAQINNYDLIALFYDKSNGSLGS